MGIQTRQPERSPADWRADVSRAVEMFNSSGHSAQVAAQFRTYLAELLVLVTPLVDAMDRTDLAWSCAAGNLSYAAHALSGDFDPLVPDHARTWTLAHACRLMVDLLADDKPVKP